jgi:hypothetical protein
MRDKAMKKPKKPLTWDAYKPKLLKKHGLTEADLKPKRVHRHRYNVVADEKWQVDDWVPVFQCRCGKRREV